MPQIVSKKNENNIQFVSNEIWQKMKTSGMARRFKVLDDSDIVGTIKDRPPKEVQDFMVEKIERPLEALNIPELKAILKEKGIDYEHGNTNQYYIDLINGN